MHFKGPTISRIVDKADPSAQKYILEVQAVREMLFLLQGNKTIFFRTEFSEDPTSLLMEVRLSGLRYYLSLNKPNIVGPRRTEASTPVSEVITLHAQCF